ncbi:MAG: hypothetical protein J5I91_10020 [Bacteroidetes bacterium]|nr:hypothetical protein [Bacteroidota bacterium]
MKNLIYISAFSVLVFLFLTSAIQKKQTQNIPSGHYSEGSVGHQPDPIFPHMNPLWKIENHTGCNFNLNLWFTLNNGQEYTYNVSVTAYGSAQFTTNDLRNNWGLVGQTIIFTNLSGNLYSVEHGHSFAFYPGTKRYQYTGNGPCSCVIVDYDYDNYKITISPC